MVMRAPIGLRQNDDLLEANLAGHQDLRSFSAAEGPRIGMSSPVPPLRIRSGRTRRPSRSLRRPSPVHSRSLSQWSRIPGVRWVRPR